MIDTNDPYTWSTRRVNYACSVERPEKPTFRDWLAVLAAYVLGACLICAGLMFGAWLASWLIDAANHIDWHSVGQLLGSIR